MGFLRKLLFLGTILSHNFLGIESQGVGEPLYLTPYIKAGQIEEAKALARVQSDALLGVVSYTGFITVNEAYGSNMFFWFIPAAYETESAPVMYWVEGGSGFTGLFEVFFGNGPFEVDKNATLHLKSQSWQLNHSMIYLDNPVGSGFSYTEDMAGFPTSGLEAVTDMYEFLTQFFQLFPELQQNDFYLGGISYSGGVYSPALAHHIHLQNEQGNPEVKINLKGAVLCAPAVMDPALQSEWGEAFYRSGLIDEAWREIFAQKYAQFLQALYSGDWQLAKKINNEMFINEDSLFLQATGFEWFAFYNILLDKPVEGDADFVPFLEKEEIRSAIHVGSVPYDYVNFTTGEQLSVNDNFRMRPFFEDLLSWTQYKILIAVGQFDLIVYPHGVNEFIRSLSWPGQAEFNSKARSIWRGPDGHVAGYWKSLGNFTQILIRNTGHDMNHENLEWTSDMVYRFTRDLPYPS